MRRPTCGRHCRQGRRSPAAVAVSRTFYESHRIVHRSPRLSPFLARKSLLMAVFRRRGRASIAARQQSTRAAVAWLVLRPVLGRLLTENLAGLKEFVGTGRQVARESPPRASSEEPRGGRGSALTSSCGRRSAGDERGEPIPSVPAVTGGRRGDDRRDRRKPGGETGPAATLRLQQTLKFVAGSADTYWSTRTPAAASWANYAFSRSTL
jgi:hypothetical protein